ncbi:MAG TPA: pilin [Streptosporangiaceae bacterium]|nr:pilin [Streptosporangiaceae bacterium]
MTIPRPRPPRRGRTARRPGRPPASRARLAARAVAAVTALGAAAALTGAAQPALASTAGHVLAVASIDQVISNITKWITGILAGLATLFLTIGGLRYLMAGGDPGEVERAKTALRSAAIGYGLAILAPVIVTVLKSLVGG